MDSMILTKFALPVLIHPLLHISKKRELILYNLNKLALMKMTSMKTKKIADRRDHDINIILFILSISIWVILYSRKIIFSAIFALN